MKLKWAFCEKINNKKSLSDLESDPKITLKYFYPLSKLADMYSLFILAITSREIPFGHSTSQAPVLEQFPKPSSSMVFTMFRTLRFASTLPCGSNAN